MKISWAVFFLSLVPFISFLIPFILKLIFVSETVSESKSLQWKKVIEMESFNRAFHTCNVVGSKVVMIGGKNGQVFHHEMKILDLNTFGISDLEVDNIYRFGHSTINFNGSLIILGGKSSDDIYNNWPFHLDVFNKKIVKSIAQNYKTFYQSAVVQDEKIILFGGRIQKGFVNSITEYIPKQKKNNLVKSKNSSPHQMAGHTAIVLNHQMYVFGGYGINKKKRKKNDQKFMIKNVWKYSFLSNTWAETKPNLEKDTKSTRAFSKAVLINNNEVYFFGGKRYNPSNGKWDELNDTIIYNIPNNSFRTLFHGDKRDKEENVISSRFGHCVFEYDGNIFIHGGRSDKNRKAFSDVYVLPLNNFSGKKKANYFGHYLLSILHENFLSVIVFVVSNIIVFKISNMRFDDEKKRIFDKNTNLKKELNESIEKSKNLEILLNSKNKTIDNLTTEISNLKTEINFKDEKIRKKNAEMQKKEGEIEDLKDLNIKLSSIF